MAKNSFKVFYSDMHIVEPADLWDWYIDPEFRYRAPRELSRHPRGLAIQLIRYFPGQSGFKLSNGE